MFLDCSVIYLFTVFAVFYSFIDVVSIPDFGSSRDTDKQNKTQIAPNLSANIKSRLINFLLHGIQLGHFCIISKTGKGLQN